MKKVYLSALLIAAGSIANAQRLSDSYHFAPLKETAKTTKTGVKPVGQAVNEMKALNIVWSEDFSGMASSNWTTGGANGSYWVIGDNPHPLSAFNWTEAMTAEYLKWDSYNPNSNEVNFATTQVNGEVISPSISYSATNSVGITFETEAMYCCNFNYAPFGISVSTDGGTIWSDTLYFDFGVERNEETELIAHPLTVVQSLESICPAGNQSTFRFKFVWDGNDADGNGQYNTHYFWLIDNIDLYEIPNTELALSAAWHGDILNDWEYSMTPLSQAREMVAGVVISNNGANQETVAITAQVVDVVNGNIGAPIVQNHTIAVGDQDTVWFNTGFTPSANGEYLVEFSIPADDIPFNDFASTSSLTVNDNVMAHDYGGTSQYGWNSGSTNPDIVAFAAASHSWGQIYSPVNTQQVYGMDIYLGSNTTTDLYLVGQVFQIDPNDQGDWIQQPLSTVMTQVELTVAAANIDAATTLVFPAPITLQAGKNYIFELNKVNSGTTGENFYVGGSEGNREDDDLACVGKGDYSATPGNVTYFNNWGQGLYIRPNFNAALAVNNLSLEGVSVFPNPTQGVITVTNANGYNNTIEVVDITGKVIVSKEANTSVQLDLTGNAHGVYLVTVTNELGQMTEKVILK